MDGEKEQAAKVEWHERAVYFLSMHTAWKNGEGEELTTPTGKDTRMLRCPSNYA